MQRGHLPAVGIAEIARQRVAGEDQVLPPQRQVQPELAPRLLDQAGRRVVRQQHEDRVAGQARDDEDHHAGADDADQALQQPCEQKA